MEWLENSGRVLAWESGLAVDADGSPDAYGPGNTGEDWTADAGHPGDWYGVVVDKGGNPIVQGPGDPDPGKYVATTAEVDHSKAVDDPARYVDSDTVPYLSIPGNAPHDFGVRVGDVGFAYCRKTGRMCPAVVADVGPRRKYGEGSEALTRALGLPGSPRNGGAESGVVVVVFKGSGRGWPRKNEDVAQQVQDLIAQLGGTPFYEQLIRPRQRQS